MVTIAGASQMGWLIKLVRKETGSSTGLEGSCEKRCHEVNRVSDPWRGWEGAATSRIEGQVEKERETGSVAEKAIGQCTCAK